MKLSFDFKIDNEKINNLEFKLITYLNTGITYTDYWLKFSLKNASNNESALLLALESVINDSIFLYKVVNNKVVKTTVIGEYLPFSTREIKHQTPIFEINLQPDEQVQYFIKTAGNGQPMNLTAKLLNAQGFHLWDVKRHSFWALSMVF